MPDFCDPDGQLSANRPQKKFDDPKMAGELFPLPDLEHWLIYQPVLRRFSET